MSRVVIIGAGPMGLAAAYQALLDGHQVDLIEAAAEPGGMSAHFDFGGISIERFYHFVCRDDQPTLELMRELRIEHKLHWAESSMGFYFHGRLNQWGNPIGLLRLPETGVLEKLRYAALVFICARRSNWSTLDNKSAAAWLTHWCGKAGYDTFWRPLLDFKFYEHSDAISAAWLSWRIRRVSRSRKSIWREEIGYIDGGSQTLVDALTHAIELHNGYIRLNCPARRVAIEDNHVVGVDTPSGRLPADFVLSTIPIPFVSGIIPDLPPSLKERYDAIQNIGICCVIFKLRRSISPHFWINVNDPDFEIPGVIEFTNLRQVGPTIVYVPYYMPESNHKFKWSDDTLCDNAFSCLVKLNPSLTKDDIIDRKVSRLRHAQPVCQTGFAEMIPPVQTPIRGLLIADTSYYYPEDRGIAESVRLGRQMARTVAMGSNE
jgi:protoporphyrinogen oxidase